MRNGVGQTPPGVLANEGEARSFPAGESQRLRSGVEGAESLTSGDCGTVASGDAPPNAWRPSVAGDRGGAEGIANAAPRGVRGAMGDTGLWPADMGEMGPGDMHMEPFEGEGGWNVGEIEMEARVLLPLGAAGRELRRRVEPLFDRTEDGRRGLEGAAPRGYEPLADEPGRDERIDWRELGRPEAEVGLWPPLEAVADKPVAEPGGETR